LAIANIVTDYYLVYPFLNLPLIPLSGATLMAGVASFAGIPGARRAPDG
jgi:hypothetical protein